MSQFAETPPPFDISQAGFEAEGHSEQDEIVELHNIRKEALEAAALQVLENYNTPKLDALRAAIYDSGFDYKNSPILDEVVEDVKADLVEQKDRKDEILSIGQSMTHLDELDKEYDSDAFKFKVLVEIRAFLGDTRNNI